MYDAEPVPVNSDAEVRDLLDKENALKEEKVLTFLNDPEESMKIFLSSYMRRQGLIWLALLPCYDSHRQSQFSPEEQSLPQA
jgi:hypothetical protein